MRRAQGVYGRPCGAGLEMSAITSAGGTLPSAWSSAGSTTSYPASPSQRSSSSAMRSSGSTMMIRRFRSTYFPGRHANAARPPQVLAPPVIRSVRRHGNMPESGAGMTIDTMTSPPRQTPDMPRKHCRCTMLHTIQTSVKAGSAVAATQTPGACIGGRRRPVDPADDRRTISATTTSPSRRWTPARRSRRSWRARKWTCLILDLKLPGEDGMQIAQRLRAHSTIPIIMLTGRKDEADPRHGPRARRRRLPHQALLAPGAAGAHPGAAAPVAQQGDRRRRPGQDPAPTALRAGI